MTAFRTVLAVLALAAGVFWVAIGVAIVTDGSAYGWGGVLVGAGLGGRGWWIVQSLRRARAERKAAAAPSPAHDLVWSGGRARGLDWEGVSLPTVDERVAAVRRYMTDAADD